MLNNGHWIGPVELATRSLQCTHTHSLSLTLTSLSHSLLVPELLEEELSCVAE